MVELENLRTANRAMEVKQRKFDSQVAEERAQVAKVIAERDAGAQEARAKETRVGKNLERNSVENVLLSFLCFSIYLWKKNLKS